MRCFIFTLIVLSVFIDTGFSQDAPLTYSIPQYLIYQNTNGSEHSYLFEGESNRIKLYHDTLFTSLSENTKMFPLENLTQFSVKQGTCFWKGAGFGALVGFTVGMIAGMSAENSPPINYDYGSEYHGKNNFATGLEYGAYYGLITGTIGALIGLILPSYSDYDLAKGSITTKRNALMKILGKNHFRKL